MAVVQRRVTIVGSSFHKGAGEWIMKMRGGQALRLQREPNNQFDPNAISVNVFQQCLGYVPRGLAAELAPLMDLGFNVTAIKSAMIGAVMEMTWETTDDPAS